MLLGHNNLGSLDALRGSLVNARFCKSRGFVFYLDVLHWVSPFHVVDYRLPAWQLRREREHLAETPFNGS